MSHVEMYGKGPFRADQIQEGDRYELSNGHAILCAPGGPDHASKNLNGGSVLDTDPEVEWAGVDAGFAPVPEHLRAPDVAVTTPQSGSAWIPGVPPLALEFASAGQDEAKLQEKIVDLLALGTKIIWVVRLIGPRRVEVYEPGKPMRTVGPDAELTAPGILRNAVPVIALFDRTAAHAATLRNLLQRRGYESLDAVRDEGQAAGRLTEARSALRRVLARRGLAPSPVEDARIEACADLAVLERWLDEAVVAKSVAEAIEPSQA